MIKMKINNNKGITLIALVITIIVMLIIASIAIYYGTEEIEKANIENIRTNMLLINAKAKEYCEEANFKLGTGNAPEGGEELEKYLEPGINYLANASEDEEKPALANNVTASDYSYIDGTKYQFIFKLNNDEALGKMGLKSIENPDKYIMAFDIINDKVEVFYTEGIKTKVDGNETTYYSLTDIENI